MTAFSLSAHILGERRSITARPQSGGWLLQAGADQRHARSLQEALNLARDYIGTFLARADRRQPWGLVVSVDGFSALYGSPDPAAGVSLGGGAPADPNSPLARIFRRWRAGDSPRSALANALDIIREAARGRGAAAA